MHNHRIFENFSVVIKVDSFTHPRKGPFSGTILQSKTGTHEIGAPIKGLSLELYKKVR